MTWKSRRGSKRMAGSGLDNVGNTLVLQRWSDRQQMLEVLLMLRWDHTTSCGGRLLGKAVMLTMRFGRIEQDKVL